MFHENSILSRRERKARVGQKFILFLNFLPELSMKALLVVVLCCFSVSAYSATCLDRQWDEVASPEVKGPWAVGAKTVKIGNLDTEVWYPSSADTQALSSKIYDIRNQLPDPRSW